MDLRDLWEIKDHKDLLGLKVNKDQEDHKDLKGKMEIKDL